MEVKAEVKGSEEESGYQQGEASVGICRLGNPMHHMMGAELCGMWAPQGASPMQTHSWRT